MSENQKIKWQAPQLIDVAALPLALGYCTTGNSQLAGCHNGATANTASGGCSSGGARVTGSCSTGNNPTNNECRNGTGA